MEQEQQSVVNNFSNIPRNPPRIKRGVLLVFVGVVILGIVTGYLISLFTRSPSPPGAPAAGSQSSQKAVYGSTDEKIFKDVAEGLLKAGGIDGEGSHHLERPGGKSQDVYLTSSVVDLSQFVGKNVKVWGQTYQAEKAGWLMDVGRLQVL